MVSIYENNCYNKKTKKQSMKVKDDTDLLLCTVKPLFWSNIPSTTQKPQKEIFKSNSGKLSSK